MIGKRINKVDKKLNDEKIDLRGIKPKDYT